MVRSSGSTDGRIRRVGAILALAVFCSLIARDAIADCNCVAQRPNIVNGSAPFVDAGGRLLTSVELQLVLWGDWTSQPPYDTQVIGAVRELMNGPYLHRMAQWRNARMGRLLPTVVKNTSTPPSLCDPPHVSAMLNGLFDNGALPKPNATYDTLYMVLLPHSSRGCGRGANGYHQSPTYPGNNVQYFYGLAIDVDGSLDGHNGSGPSITQVLTHELAEAITDPVPAAAVTAQPNGCSCEIGDVCDDQPLMVPAGYTVSRYFSPVDNSCTAPIYWAFLFAYGGSPNNWLPIATNILQIAAGGFGTVVETSDMNLWLLPDSGGGWMQVGTGPVSMLAVDNQAAYLLPMDIGYSIYRNSGGAWSSVNNNGSTSISGGDTIYATDMRGVVHQGPSNNAGSWPTLDSSRVANQLSSASSGPWIITSDHQNVMKWNGSRWVVRGGPAKQLYTGTGGVAATSPSNDQLYWYLSGTSWIWQGWPGYTFAVASGPQLFGVTPDRSAVYQDTAVGTSNPPWQQITGAVNNMVAGGSLLFALVGFQPG